MKEEDYDKAIEVILDRVKFFHHQYKKVGYVLLILTLPFSIAVLVMMKELWPDFSNLYKGKLPLLVIQYPITLSLIFLVFSKEKVEDEMIQLMRFKSFVHGVYLLIVIALMFPFLSLINNLIFDTPFQIVAGDFHTSVNFLLFYIFISMRARIFLENRKLKLDEK